VVPATKSAHEPPHAQVPPVQLLLQHWASMVQLAPPNLHEQLPLMQVSQHWELGVQDAPCGRQAIPVLLLEDDELAAVPLDELAAVPLDELTAVPLDELAAVLLDEALALVPLDELVELEPPEPDELLVPQLQAPHAKPSAAHVCPPLHASGPTHVWVAPGVQTLPPLVPQAETIAATTHALAKMYQKDRARACTRLERTVRRSAGWTTWRPATLP
jgi:hypothetical protein